MEVQYCCGNQEMQVQPYSTGIFQAPVNRGWELIRVGSYELWGHPGSSSTNDECSNYVLTKIG